MSCVPTPHQSAPTPPLNPNPVGRIGKVGTFIAALTVAGTLMALASPPLALLAGMGFALCLGNPFSQHGPKIAKQLLQTCVVLLGFGMNLPVILKAGWDGALFAAMTITATLVLGYGLGRWLNLSRNTATLISAGTAICGGSAIAAVGSVLSVAEGEIAVAMGTVFLLNAVALYLFPMLGHALQLSAEQFGVWAGVAVHDISSVVGAALVFGKDSLETATAVKLSRTLWIIPVTVGLAMTLGRKATPGQSRAAHDGNPTGSRNTRITIPWFIGFFLLASLARSYVPEVAVWSPFISKIGRAGFIVVLFLIGASLSPRTLRAVGWKAALQGVVLWLFISATSLAVIYHHGLGF